MSDFEAADMLRGLTAISTHLGVSDKTALRLCRDGEIPGFRLGHTWCLRKSTWVRHVQDRESGAHDPRQGV